MNLRLILFILFNTSVQKPMVWTLSEPNSSVSYATDDVIYSGAGCYDDDEDNCREVEGSGDELITPVYITRPPTATTPYTMPSTHGSTLKCDTNDGNCSDSSGSGDQVFPVYTTQSSVTQQPIWDRPIYHISGTPRQPTHQPHVPESQEPPTIYVVREIPKTFVKETAKPSQPVQKSTSDRTVMLIGVIAIIAIVVVIIAPIVLYLKVWRRTDTVCNA